MNSVPLATSAANESGDKRLRARAEREKFIFLVVCFLATVHLVWYYLDNLPTILDIVRYENGVERMPFQGRLLMEWPLRWAHASPFLRHACAWITALHMWMPRGVYPEDIVEFTVGLIAVIAAGLVARDLYRYHSKTRRLTGFVYPLFLIMVSATYFMPTSHVFRYVYDLPSLGFFACGLYLIYRKRHPMLFAIVFIIGTLNRETTLFLLFFFLISSLLVDEKIVWKRAFSLRVLGTVLPLAIFWLGWHVWVTRHFAGLDSESKPRAVGNLIALAWPFMWPGMAAVAAYTLPILLFFKSRTRSLELRLWLWVVPLWAVFMFFYGMFVEVRLFGELIPLFACTAVLLAEERLFAAPPQLEG
jgi:hypothetical protein